MLGKFTIVQWMGQPPKYIAYIRYYELLNLKTEKDTKLGVGREMGWIWQESKRVVEGEYEQNIV